MDLRLERRKRHKTWIAVRMSGIPKTENVLLDHPFAVPSLPQCVASVSGSLFQRNSPITIGSNVIKVVIMIMVWISDLKGEKET